MAEWLATVAGVIGSITVIGAFLIKVTKWIIIDPQEKKKVAREKKLEEERQEFERKLLKQFDVSQQPLNESITRLNNLLDKSQRDRKALHKIADENVKRIGKHEERLDNHNDRLIVLEVKNGIKTYTEVYKGEEK